MPGALPVINRKAVAQTMFTALALHCDVPQTSKFDRKNYSYPDLPKGYQISQYETPIGLGGWLVLGGESGSSRCGISRVHLEEDTGKTSHLNLDGRDVSLVDYNRSGVPLMEIVGAPDLKSPEAARDFFASLRQILMYLGVCDGNLQEGSMRADVNVSLRRADGEPGVKIEVKNLNSFRAVQRALEFEIERQQEVLRSGGQLLQETRGWSEARDATIAQRSKEYADDYRYFPEPDLPMMTFSPERIKEVRRSLPELPAEKRNRLTAEYGVSGDAAQVLTSDIAIADFFEATAKASAPASGSEVANWTHGELLRLLNERQVGVRDLAFSPAEFGRLISLVSAGKISNTAGKQVLERMFETGDDPQAIVQRLNLTQLDDVEALGQIVKAVLSENPAVVADYRGGKSAALNVLLGKAMKESGGRANPRLVREILEGELPPPEVDADQPG
jgi:aspartyl-tRNA(Asn)/glutamyl-tRNA(Gln) amidotransferase subunit B